MSGLKMAAIVVDGAETAVDAGKSFVVDGPGACCRCSEPDRSRAQMLNQKTSYHPNTACCHDLGSPRSVVVVARHSVVIPVSDPEGYHSSRWHCWHHERANYCPSIDVPMMLMSVLESQGICCRFPRLGIEYSHFEGNAHYRETLVRTEMRLSFQAVSSAGHRSSQDNFQTLESVADDALQVPRGQMAWMLLGCKWRGCRYSVRCSAVVPIQKTTQVLPREMQ